MANAIRDPIPIIDFIVNLDYSCSIVTIGFSKLLKRSVFMCQLKLTNLKDKNRLKQYFYNINFTVYEENLCKMEMKYLFHKVPKDKYFLSYHYVDPSRSPFIKQCISIIYTGNTLEDIINEIIINNLSYEKFKVRYINVHNESISFEKRRKIEYKIGFNIAGKAEMKYPKVILGVTKVYGKWILGEYSENKSDLEFHNRKPYCYSNALGVRVARALVNIAVSNNLKSMIVDPCCGIGTVVIEALSMGIDIKGYEINPCIAENAKKNLEFFGYDNVITHGNMHNLQDTFDAAIVDLPYGLFSPTTLKEQIAIINTTRRIANTAVIVTLENMDQYILSCGFNIVDRCYVSKGKFTRHITICK